MPFRGTGWATAPGPAARARKISRWPSGLCFPGPRKAGTGTSPERQDQHGGSMHGLLFMLNMDHRGWRGDSLCTGSARR